MQTRVGIDAGICGFRTVAGVRSDDSQNVTVEIVKAHTPKLVPYGEGREGPIIRGRVTPHTAVPLRGLHLLYEHSSD